VSLLLDLISPLFISSIKLILCCIFSDWTTDTNVDCGSFSTPMQ
jgi:hypothetical protein